MRIDTNRLAELANELSLDVEKGCCESAVTIGEIDGVIFRLVAMSEDEAEEQDVDGPLLANECIVC